MYYTYHTSYMYTYMYIYYTCIYYILLIGGIIYYTVEEGQIILKLPSQNGDLNLIPLLLWFTSVVYCLQKIILQ